MTRFFHSFVMYRIWILLLALVMVGCQKAATAPSTNTASEIDPHYGHLLHALPKLPTIKLWLGDQVLDTEIAARPLEIATGMMYRTNMPENTAMLFVFPDAAPRSFYMRNCFIDLSGAYMSPGGEILQLIEMKKHDETPINSRADNIQFVLEVPAGWFARHNIKPGAVALTERGSLRQTFFGRN